jgi:RNA recognition motif-containing protein
MPVAVVDQGGPRKIFVGSIPDAADEVIIRAEYSRYGQILDVYLKENCEPGRRWGFVTFATAEQARIAKESTDLKLILPGGQLPCEVKMAKNQGLFGQNDYSPAAPVAPAAQLRTIQPPPPVTPPPAHLTPWRLYRTAGGLPYYHNHTNNVTQWECPPELQAPGLVHSQPIYTTIAGVAPASVQRYSPY